jgi:predicted Zn-dependent peptidase
VIRPTISFGALSVLLAFACAEPRGDAGPAAREAQAAPAAPAGAPSLALPPGERFVYESGTTLTVVPMRELPLVTVHLYAEGGARLESEGKTGLASFTAGLLDEGPAGMTRSEFLAALDRLGAQFGAKGSLDDVSLTLDFLARDLDAGLELLFAAALAPAFEEEAVARARERTLGELIAAREDEANLARDAFFARLFPGHRYGRPLAGTPATVGSFTRDDVAAFHRAVFAPKNVRVIVVGDVQPAATGLAVARAASKRGVELGVAMAAPKPAPAAATDAGAAWPKRQILLVDKPGVVQPQVLFGCRGPGATDPDLTALRAANVPFGGGFTSWLVDRLRVDLGLTYSAGSAVRNYSDGGVFFVRSFSKSATVGALLGEAFALLDKLQRGELDEAALARARLSLVTRTVEQMETTSGVAGLVKEEQLLGRGADSVARFARELDALTLPRLKEAIARHLPDSQHVLCVVVGDAKEIGEQLRALGPEGTVEVVDYKSLAPDAAPAAGSGGGG